MYIKNDRSVFFYQTLLAFAEKFLIEACGRFRNRIKPTPKVNLGRRYQISSSGLVNDPLRYVNFIHPRE